MFSYFANRSQNIPIGSLTLQELHQQLVNPDRVPFTATVNVIQRLRAASDEADQKRIKGELPAFTPGAMLDTRDKDATPDQKNIRPSGFMQVDIDLQDNKNMNDAEAIRNKLATIPYIALAAISARGKGVWGLVALAEPDKFMQYVSQVNEYFSQARVTLDKSKGKNPAELRYFAPDPGAILKHDYKLMPLLPPAPVIKSKPINHRHQQATGSTFAELQQWVTDTTGFSLIDGQKHYYLFWLSYALKKNGASEPDVYSAIHSIYPENLIHSNCISGGISHANKKGIYTPQQRISATQTAPQQITPPQQETPPQATATSREAVTPPQQETPPQATETSRATIAVEADEIIEVLREETERERLRKQSENAVNRFTDVAYDNKLTQAKQPERVTTKLASTFNTNRTYVSQAQKLKETALQNMIAEQKIRTQRILGQLIKDGQDKGEIATQSTGGSGSNQYASVPERDTSTVKTLSDIGITRKESSTLQEIWHIIEKQFTGRLNPYDWLRKGKTSDEIYYDLTVLSADCLINYGIDVSPDQYYNALKLRESTVNNTKNKPT